MNKKSLVGITLAAILISLTTVIVVSISKSVEDFTKNVCNIVNSKLNDISVNINKKQTKTIVKRINSNRLSPALAKHNIENNNKSIIHTKNLSNEQGLKHNCQNSDVPMEKSEFEIFNIANKRLASITKKAFSKYLGLDIEKKIKEDNLKVNVNTVGSEISVSFEANRSKIERDCARNIIDDEDSITISKEDGNVTSIYGINGVEEKVYPFDNARIMAETVKYLKNKGLPTNIHNIEMDDNEKSLGMDVIHATYPDRSLLTLYFSAKDYKVVHYCCSKSPYSELNFGITNEKAIQIAKDALSKYLGVDIEKKIVQDGLKTNISRYGNSVEMSEIEVSFDASLDKYQRDGENSIIDDYDSVYMNGNGIINSVRGINDLEEKEYPVDEIKVRTAAVKFIKDNGLYPDVKSVEIDDSDKKLGMVTAYCTYVHNKYIVLKFKTSDYSVVEFDIYGA